ncbi:MAG: BrnT family toxin [Bryobacteraceae bacterium]
MTIHTPSRSRIHESDPNEQRLVTLGIGAACRWLVVAYTWRGENIRIVSARPAERHEREEYEAEG